MNTENNDFPQELKGFNWGALFLTWIWGIGHKVWIALYSLLFYIVSLIGGIFGLYLLYQLLNGRQIGTIGWISLVCAGLIGNLVAISSLAFAIYLGFKGSQLAWKTGRYNDIQKFKEIEKKWTIAGIIVFIANLIIAFPIACVIILIIFSSTIKTMDKMTDPLMESAHKKTAVNLKEAVEFQSNKKTGKYCGGFGLINCGKYSFEDSSSKLEKVGREVPLAGTCSGSEQFCGKCNDPFSGVEGGGYIEIKADGYTIIPYDAKCKTPIQGAKIHKEK